MCECVYYNVLNTTYGLGGRLHTECTSVHDWPMPTVHTYVHMYVCMYVCNVVYHGNTTCSSKYLKRAMAIPKLFFQGASRSDGVYYRDKVQQENVLWRQWCAAVIVWAAALGEDLWGSALSTTLQGI